MQIKSLRLISYRSWRIDETILSPKAQEKEKKLKQYEQLREEGCSEKTALAVVGISRPTYFRWKKERLASRMALEPKSRAPKNTRKKKWTKQLEQQVLFLRIKFPQWGKLKITEILLREYGRKECESTIGRIISYLIKKGKIKPVNFYYGQMRQKKARSFHGHAKRLKKGMKAKKAGELIQIDHMKVYLMSGIRVAHFQATCPITKITHTKMYSRATSRCAKDFLHYIQKRFPFPILSIQVDGGSEFRQHFEKECEILNIPLFVLPPRSPELNGNVERRNGTFRYEFYSTYSGIPSIYEAQKDLEEYTTFYNTFRPHQSLNQMTPMAYFQSYFQGGL